MKISVERADGGIQPLLLDVEPETTWSSILSAAGPASAELPLVSGCRVSPDATVADHPLRDGDHVGQPLLATPIPPPGTLLLTVSNGPGAGQFCVLPDAGQLIVGRNEPIPLGDRQVSRHGQCTITVHQDGTISVLDGMSGASHNGTRVNGVPAAAAGSPGATGLPVALGSDVIRIGRTGLVIRRVPRLDAMLRDDGTGALAYNRPPSHQPDIAAKLLSWPPPEPVAARPTLDWIMIGVPLVLGVTMAMLLHRPEFLAFTLLSPMMLLARWLADRGRIRRKGRRGSAEYARKVAALEDQLTVALVAEAAARRESALDPATALITSVGPTTALWEQRIGAAQALCLRVGLGSGQPLTRADGREEPLPPLPDVPIVVDLTEQRCIGVTGTTADLRALARWLAIQLAVRHSPEELKMTLLLASRLSDSEDDWGFTRWLPHFTIDQAEPAASVGAAIESLGRRVKALRQLIEERQQAGANRAQRIVHVVFLDGVYDLQLSQRLGPLLDDGPDVGVYFICLDESRASLPKACQAHVALDVNLEDTQLIDGIDRTTFVPDLASAAYAERIARSLSPIRDVGGLRQTHALPAKVMLSELIETDLKDPVSIQAGWQASPRSTRALIGMAASGAYEFDLTAGPHVLIGGTTRAGKSELLITLITSLALVNRPDALDFVLIDYKGRSAFRPFEDLPHKIGLVTDLNADETERALTAIDAEIKKRKVLLDEAGASTIEGYWRLRDEGDPRAVDPLPRLLIVVDEYAALVTELPGFVERLVKVAAQGGAYGLHLLLATQRPSSKVVSADIAANINLRIALRAADAGQSQLIIGSSEASTIPYNQRGRAYVRTGEDSAPEAVQIAMTAAPAAGEQALTAVQWDWGRMDVLPEREPAEHGELVQVVKVIRQAAEDAQIRAGRPLWHDVLPHPLPLDRLDGSAGSLVFGQCDQPAEQTQDYAELRLDDGGGHLLVGGGPESGRTTLLRSIAASALSRYRADQLQIYAIDGGNGLAVLERFAAVGAVATSHEPDRAGHILARLAGEVNRRQQLFAAAGCGTLAEYHARPGREPLPYLLLLVDSYEALNPILSGYDSGRAVSSLGSLLQKGYPTGVVCVLAGDRTLLTSRLAGAVIDKLVLPLTTPVDYQMLGITTGRIPGRRSGTGIRLPSGDFLHVAVAGGDPSGGAQHSYFRELATQLSGRRPPGMIVIDRMPDRVTVDDWQTYVTAPDVTLPVGIGGEQLARRGFDLAVDGPCFVVAGGRSSGKTNVLRLAARSALQAGWRVVTVGSPELAAAEDLRTAEHLVAVNAPTDVIELTGTNSRPTFLIIDDADTLDGPSALALAAVIRAARTAGHRVIGSATLSDAPIVKGLVQEMRSSRSGVLLDARPTFGTVLEVGRLPEWACGGGEGTGTLVRRGAVSVVRIPLLEAGTTAEAGTTVETGRR